MKTDDLGSFQRSLLMFRKNGWEGRDPCHLSGGRRLLGGKRRTNRKWALLMLTVRGTQEAQVS